MPDRPDDLRADLDAVSERKGVERDVHRALDRVLDRHESGRGFTERDRVYYVGHGTERDQLCTFGLRQREQRLLREGPGWAQVRKTRHRRTAPSARLIASSSSPERLIRLPPCSTGLA